MSSPRQKTVVVASPQPNELEQKKRRQTLERAKANHLSKQLQMRLQYAKLKVEHGWQRQNLNEVENLYFHHSHLRSMRQGVGQRPHYVTMVYPPAPGPPSVPPPAETNVVQSPAPSGIPDRSMGPSPSANDASSSDPVSPPSQSPSEHAPPADGRPSSQPSAQSQPFPPVQTPVPVAPLTSISMNRPPSAFDLSDPNILARLAQLQAQVQMTPQSWANQTLSRQPLTTVPPSTSTSTSASHSIVPGPIPAIPGTFPPHVQLVQPSMSHPQPGFALPACAPQPLFSTSTPGSVPIYPVPASTPLNPAAPSQSPAPVPPVASHVASALTAPIPTTPIPTPTSIASSALTYDSFWSTHASSSGSARALYRTHTGFTASVTPGGNVAMLTPGGHAAVMTAEGVYVGGASNRSG